MDSAKDRMKNWLEARGVEAPSDDKELVKATIGYAHVDDEFVAKETFNWYIPGGAATTKKSSESSETPTGAQSPTGTQTPTGAQSPTGTQTPTGTQSPTGTENPDAGQGGSDDPGQSEIEVKQESDAWTYVYNEATFNASLENGGLAKYYEKYPAEDLESTTGAGNATFNDRVYVGSLDDSNEVVEFKAGWEETSQKLTKVGDDTVVYYMKRVDDQGNQYEVIAGEDWTLYTDAALETEAGHVFHVTSMEFDGFEHTYNAAVNAPGSTLPWVVVSFDGDTTYNVEFEYDGAAVPTQWDHAINWGVVSVANDLGIANFDEAKLKMYIFE